MIIQGAHWVLCCSAFGNICFMPYGNMNSVKIHYSFMKCGDLNQFFINEHGKVHPIIGHEGKRESTGRALLFL